MEGQDLLSLVKGRIYNAALRAEIAERGFRRIGGTQWISKITAYKYEMVLTENGDEKIVSGVDVVEKDYRVHLMDTEEKPAISEELVNTSISVHYKTIEAIDHQLDICDYYNHLIYDIWNSEISMNTPFGRELKQITNGKYIDWFNLVILPDPLARGRHLFGVIRTGKTAAIHAWLDLQDGRYIVPVDGTDEGAMDSLKTGLEFHAWENEHFETPAAAGQFAIKAINHSKSSYAMAIKKLLGKEDSPISRNDFYRNSAGVMCRMDVDRTDVGVIVTEQIVNPTLSECIDSLLAPYIKSTVLNSIGK